MNSALTSTTLQLNPTELLRSVVCLYGMSTAWLRLLHLIEPKDQRMLPLQLRKGERRNAAASYKSQLLYYSCEDNGCCACQINGPAARLLPYAWQRKHGNYMQEPFSFSYSQWQCLSVCAWNNRCLKHYLPTPNRCLLVQCSSLI